MHFSMMVDRDKHVKFGALKMHLATQSVLKFRVFNHRSIRFSIKTKCLELIIQCRRRLISLAVCR
jgi:hypothetical protein